VQQPKKSVKALGALLQMKGPLPMPGLAGMAAPPPSLRQVSAYFYYPFFSKKDF